MKEEMKVLLFLKRVEEKDGFCPVMGKISIRGNSNSVAQFASKIKVKTELWNATSQRCVGKSHLAVSTNKEIESLLLQIREKYNELIDCNTMVTALDVKKGFQGITASQTTLLKIYQEHNDQYALRVGVNRAPSTYYQYRNTLRFVSEFIKSKYKVSDVALKSLDCLFIENFDLHLRIVENQKPATILGHINRLKSVVYTAIDRGLLYIHPFKDFSPEKPKKKNLQLTSEELSKLMNMTYDTPNRNFTRDMFVFAAFTGYSYCDMCNLSEKDIHTDDEGTVWILKKRLKTGTPENVPLPDIALTIVEKYKGTAQNGKLFPMLQNESINPHLKKIAKQCGIERNLTFHMARHTFGSSSLSQGVPIEAVSRAMGHKNITTTQRYAKVSNEKLFNDADNFNSLMAKKYTLQGVDQPPSRIRKDRKKRDIGVIEEQQNNTI